MSATAKRLAFGLALIAVEAFAARPRGFGGPPTTAESLSAVTYTTAPVVLYVDTTGNDANACTGTGTAACLTTQGALNKSPKELRHQLTITHACGSYAGATVSGFTVDPSVQHTTAGILIDGALSNVTPTTGSATGTATSGSAGSGTTFGTLTNSGEAWTVDNFKGAFITITGGTGSGQTRVITTNSATVITIAGTWTAPSGTSTYAIQNPCVLFTTGVTAIPTPLGVDSESAAGFQIVDNEINASRITFRNVWIQSATSRSVLVSGPQVVDLFQTRISGATAIGVELLNKAVANITFSTASAATTNSPISAQSATVTVTNSLVGSASSVAAAAISGLSSTLTVSSNQTVNNGLLSMSGSSTGLASGNRCDCASVASSECIRAGSNVLSANGVRGSDSLFVGSVNVANCAYGLLAGGGSTITAQTSTSAWAGTATIFAANARLGGLIVTPATDPTLTGTTADASVDNGATTTAFSTLNAANVCLTATGTGSRICSL